MCKQRCSLPGQDLPTDMEFSVFILVGFKVRHEHLYGLLLDKGLDYQLSLTALIYPLMNFATGLPFLSVIETEKCIYFRILMMSANWGFPQAREHFLQKKNRIVIAMW